MKVNEANWDRIARVALGVVVMSLVVLGPKTPWGFLGVVPIVTGLIGYCPVYRIFGFSTCPAHGAQ